MPDIPGGIGPQLHHRCSREKSVLSSRRCIVPEKPYSVSK